VKLFVNTRSSTAVLAAVGALALAGCGGSSKHSSSANGAGAPTASTPARSVTTGGSGSASASGSGGSRAAGKGGKRGGSGSSGSAGTATTGSSGSAATGSGGSGGSAATGAGQSASSTPQVPPTFAAQADAICSTYRHNVSGLTKATGLVAQERVFPTLLREARHAIAQLRALPPPAPDSAAFGRFTALTLAAVRDFVKAQSRSRSTSESQGTAVSAQDFATFKKFGKETSAASALARHMGMHVCGSAGSDWL
jgi:hypothetical protein